MPKLSAWLVSVIVTLNVPLDVPFTFKATLIVPAEAAAAIPATIVNTKSLRSMYVVLVIEVSLILTL
jgi:hypothetical protein